MTDSTLEALLGAPAAHVSISRDLDGTHIAVPVSNHGAHVALRALGLVTSVTVVVVGMWLIAIFGVGYLFGQLPRYGEPLRLASPSGIALLITVGAQMLAAPLAFPLLLRRLGQVSTWTLLLRPNTLVVDGRTISYGEIEDVTHTAAGSLTLRLDSGETFRLAQRVIFTEAERAPVVWLRRVLIAAIQRHQAPQGTPADIPRPLSRVRDR